MIWLVDEYVVDRLKVTIPTYARYTIMVWLRKAGNSAMASSGTSYLHTPFVIYTHLSSASLHPLLFATSFGKIPTTIIGLFIKGYHFSY